MLCSLFRTASTALRGEKKKSKNDCSRKLKENKQIHVINAIYTKQTRFATEVMLIPHQECFNACLCPALTTLQLQDPQQCSI